LEEPEVAISALRRAAPLALAADAPAGPQGSPLLSWSSAEVDVPRVPACDIPEPITGLHDLAAKPFNDQALDDQALLGPLLESCFADLTEAGGDSDPATARAMVQTITQLALIERGIIRPRSRAAQYTIRAGRLSLARRLIAGHIAQAQLSPNFVANLLGISVRHLHVLFEAAPRSFAQTVTALRIERSRQLLREAPAMAIAEIAVASGFDSIATYYRVFRAHQGITPGDFRDANVRPAA